MRFRHQPPVLVSKWLVGLQIVRQLSGQLLWARHQLQSNKLLSLVNYTPSVISNSYKKKLLTVTLSSQLVLSQTGRILLFYYKIRGAPAKLKNQQRPISVNFSQNICKLSGDPVPLNWDILITVKNRDVLFRCFTIKEFGLFVQKSIDEQMLLC